MTHDVPPTGSGSRPDPLDQILGAVRGLGIHRDQQTRWLSGVCSGTAQRLRVDPLIVRAAFILGTCLFGIAVPLYIIAWVLLPDGDDHIVLERAVREGHGPSVTACIVLGIILLNSIWIFWSWGSWGFGIGPLIVAGLIVWAFASGRVHRRDLQDPGDVARRVREGMERTEWVDRMREGWRTGATPGNRAAQAGADHRSGIDLTKHPEGADPYAAPGSGRPMAPPRPAPPSPPKRPTLGAYGLLVLGVAAIAGAATALGAQATTWHDDALQVGLAAATVVVGLGLLIGGLLGRRGGFVGGIGIPLVIVTVLALLVPSGLAWSGGTGTRDWQPQAVTADSRHTFGLVAGDATLDLRRIDPATMADDVTLDSRVNIGDLTIQVPEGMTVRFRARVDVGQMHLPASALRQTGDGAAPSGTGLERDFTIGSGAPDLTIDARVGVGNLTVQER